MTGMRLNVFFFASTLMLFGLSVAGTAQAQPAGSSYFHRGAHLFIDGSTTEAKGVVMEGLRAAPNDPKLLALKKKLEQQQKQQSQSGKSNQQKKQDQNQQSKSNQGQQKGNNEQSSKSKKSGQQQEQKQQKEQSSQEQQKQQRAGKQKQQQSPQTARRAPYRNPKKMSKQQALRILQALGNQEQKLLREIKEAESRPRHVEKDW